MNKALKYGHLDGETLPPGIFKKPPAGWCWDWAASQGSTIHGELRHMTGMRLE